MPNSQPHRKIVALLAKWPEPGRVKTRLGESIGMATAAELHHALVEQTVEMVPTLFELQVWVSPADRLESMRSWLEPRHPHITFHPQPEGDLGIRLQAVFESNAAASTIAIGADCPSMTGRELELAAVYLDRHDLVIGPARDGGYYLIAMRRFHRELFHDIPWSSNQTKEVTAERANAAGLSWCELEMLDDLDNIEDWQRLAPPVRKALMVRLGKE